MDEGDAQRNGFPDDGSTTNRRSHRCDRQASHHPSTTRALASLVGGALGSQCTPLERSATYSDTPRSACHVCQGVRLWPGQCGLNATHPLVFFLLSENSLLGESFTLIFVNLHPLPHFAFLIFQRVIAP